HLRSLVHEALQTNFDHIARLRKKATLVLLDEDLPLGKHESIQLSLLFPTLVAPLLPYLLVYELLPCLGIGQAVVQAILKLATFEQVGPACFHEGWDQVRECSAHGLGPE